MAAAAPPAPIDLAKIETRLFINNEFVDALSGKKFDTVNPVTEEVICQVHEADSADVDVAVAAAKAAFELGAPWREMDASGRGRLINKLADAIERDQDYLLQLESIDNGKPVAKDGKNYGVSTDMYLILQHFRYYAGWADKNCGKTVEIDGPFFAYTRHEPVGVCGMIIPWNFPMLMMAWKLGPALATGCTMVLKSSEKTPLTALHIGALCAEVGFPAGVVNVLSGYGPTAGQALARHMDISKIAFTGSTAVGKLIQRYSSESNLKKVSLELGGKSPMIVFDDADIEQALGAAHVGLFLNQGQCCCAGSRLFVQEGIYDTFVAACVEKANARKLGNPLENGTAQGPQVDKIQFESIMGYIEKGKAEGATCLAGGERFGEKGYYVKPTVFGDVTDDMTIAREEIFGPVMSILKFSTVDEVIKRANDTLYGLGAGLCTRDIGKALRVAHSIRAGTVWINCYDKFDAGAPFGGFKQSGVGREGGEYGLRNYYNVKVVMVPIDK